jgi:predicted metal-dependent peptidase
MQMAHDKALSKAKIRLMEKKDSAFYTYLCFSMKHIWDENTPTAAAYAYIKTIKWNPEFFMGLADAEEQLFLMLHEVMHIAYMHVERCGDRDRKVWGAAIDHVINLHLIARGFKMPTGKNQGFADPRFEGMSAEEVYKILKQESDERKQAASGKPMPGQGDPTDQGGGPGTDEPWLDDLDYDEDKITEEVARQVDDLLVRAAIQSKMAGDRPGTIPGDIEVYLDKLLNPKLPWYRIFQKQFDTYKKNDHSWMRPNRRFMPKHYLPSLYSPGLGSLYFFGDLSGSVTDHDINRIRTETCAVLRMFQPEEIRFIQFDTAVRSEHRLRSIKELMQMPLKGRGGTDVQEIIELINTRKPKCSVIFTDGEFEWPDVPNPATQVIWLIHNNPGFTAPFGKVIHYEP